MPPRKRSRASSARRAAAPSPAWRVPSDILLEIAAQTDTATLIRCAAACKTLRREIIQPDFIRRVCNERDGIVPPTLTLGFLAPESTFHLLHPATPATVSLAADHLAPFLTRTAAGLLEQYRPLTSCRGGLVLLERRCVNMRRWSERRSDMCVYDPMTNSRAFFPFPSEVRSGRYEHRGHVDHLIKYVLLTAADDGVGCSFFLVAVDIMSCSNERVPLRVQTLSSADGGEWGPVANGAFPCSTYDNAAIVVDGVIHWLLVLTNHILTYNISTATAGLVRLPVDTNYCVSEYCLGSSTDGKLCLFTMDGFKLFIWLLSQSPAGGWRRRAVVDMKVTLRSLMIRKEYWDDHAIELESCGDQRSGVVLLRLSGHGGRNALSNKRKTWGVEVKA
ncbi:hypothetical protein EJB05_24025, partial [Eragrostis curvula]